ncbi:hypothetical protein BJY01DRAFT_263229 [Aspergillus pseudoustus]|uniref:Zn(2)-C6 fungal-type domain-containing protein n=1 Tax=Aspergillus pseudoustus TaxID=1810923 RepID=A0ABR4K3K0_9EURO
MDQYLPEGARPRRSGARSRKGRHTRCDEALPVCGNCRKSRRICQQPEFISSKWNTFAPAVAESERGTDTPPDPNLDGQCVRTNHTYAPESRNYGRSEVQEPHGISCAAVDRELASPSAESKITREMVHLLRVYEKSIGTWMVVFDSQDTYQRELLFTVPSSPLLLNATCALAARQLSLIRSPLTWKPVAERYYGQAVHMLARLLNAYPSNMEFAIVATILLCSYELLAFPGLDYQRHFKGAHTMVQSLHAYNSEISLTRASFWIYARLEVAEALNRGSPTLHDPGLWPKVNLSDAEPVEDSFSSEVLRMAAETVCVVFGETSGGRAPRRKREMLALQGELCTWLRLCPKPWKGVEYEEDGHVRYWFARPNFAAALVFYHLSMLLLWVELEKVQKGPDSAHEISDQVDVHAKQIILIALSSLPDSAIVVVVQPLCYAVKHVRDNTLKEDAILFLDDTEARTGFHTKSKLERQLCH